MNQQTAGASGKKEEFKARARGSGDTSSKVINASARWRRVLNCNPAGELTSLYPTHNHRFRARPRSSRRRARAQLRKARPRCRRCPRATRGAVDLHACKREIGVVNLDTPFFFPLSPARFPLCPRFELFSLLSLTLHLTLPLVCLSPLPFFFIAPCLSVLGRWSQVLACGLECQPF